MPNTKTKKKGKTARGQVHPVSVPDFFEAVFQARLGQTPLEWVKMKVEGGSQLESIQYLFEISAA